MYRGDELLQVNGKAVAGEKLAGIHKLIFNETNTEVKMKFKEIQHKICNGKCLSVLLNSCSADLCHSVVLQLLSPHFLVDYGSHGGNWSVNWEGCVYSKALFFAERFFLKLSLELISK